MLGRFSEALKAESEMDEVDVVVPKSEIAAFIKYTKELEAEFGVRMRASAMPVMATSTSTSSKTTWTGSLEG